MTALVAILLQLLFGVAGVVSPPAPVVFHDVPQANGITMQCTVEDACTIPPVTIVRVLP